MINREQVHDLVKLFYQPTSKSFYINSEDGKEFIKPTGVFISLGMTTSYKTIENIKDFIVSSKQYSAKLVEISSVKEGDQFLNTVISENPKQYKLDKLPDNIITKEEAEAELAEMKTHLDPHNSLEKITEYSARISKLQYYVDKLNDSNGWDAHKLQKVGDSDYRIYHLFVNYKEDEGVEYRVGILVTDKEN